MALSAQERRLLADIEQRLRSEDPELAHALSTMQPAGGPARPTGRGWPGLLLAVVAVLLITWGLLFGGPDQAPSAPKTGEVTEYTRPLGVVP
jgi:hypothetical protein